MRTGLTGTRAELPDAFRERLAAVLQRAVERARLLRRPVLASLTLPLGDAAQAPPVAAAGAARFCLWQRPSARQLLYGAGVAADFEASGSSRFRAVREWSARLFSEALVEAEGTSTAPRCFVGFTFDPARPGDDRWQGFPDALAFVPRYLVAQEEDIATLGVNAVVTAGSDAGLQTRTLTDELQDLLAAWNQAPAGKQEPAALRIADEAVGWHESVRALVAAIGRGEVDKVVLARRVDLARAGGFDLDGTLARLRRRYDACTIFASGTRDACFLGATPETLVQLEDSVARTDCLAGSAPRGGSEAEDAALGAALLADDKERREHAFVREFLLAALQPLCETIDAPETPLLRRMANVQHLHTPVSATPRPRRHVLDFVEALHPTPATAGSPGGRALCLIRGRESFSRGWYAGPIGWFDAAGNGEFAVALRSGIVRGEEASLFAGCGIVAGSDAEREFQESRIKLEAMSWALAAAGDCADRPGDKRATP